MSRKQKTQLKLKAQFGYFIINIGVYNKEVESLLSQMKFELSFNWHYYPIGKISANKLEQKSAPYIHTLKPNIENFSNREILEDNTF